MEQPTQYNAIDGNWADGSGASVDNIREALKGFRTLQNLVHESEEAPECMFLVCVPGKNGSRDAFWNTYVDESESIRVAQALGGVIATIPLSHDFRR